MSYLPPDVDRAAQELLTPKQLEVFELEQRGWSINRIAGRLRISKGATYDRLQGAHNKLYKAGVRQDEWGRWSIERVA